MKFGNSDTTCFCIATPTGRGAVATLIVAGRECYKIVNRYFQSVRERPITSTDTSRVIYGRWKSDGETGEDLVICPIGDNRIDIHCHGGEFAVQAISDSLIKAGAKRLGLPEFVACHDSNDYFAGLHLAVVKAQTNRAAKWLWDQSKWHELFLQQLKQCIDSDNQAQALQMINDFLDLRDFGLRIVNGWSITLCGRPNAGKSSLVNAILGYQRAIVHDRPGTTRDIVESMTTLSGWPVRLSDTAGIHQSDDVIEKQGILQAYRQLAAADFSILVIDPTDFSEAKLLQLKNELAPDLVVANKCDLEHLDSASIDCSVSAITGQGIDTLIIKLGELIDQSIPKPNTPFPVSVFQVTSMAQIRQFIETDYSDDAAKLLNSLLLRAND